MRKCFFWLAAVTLTTVNLVCTAKVLQVDNSQLRSSEAQAATQWAFELAEAQTARGDLLFQENRELKETCQYMGGLLNAAGDYMMALERACVKAGGTLPPSPFKKPNNT